MGWIIACCVAAALPACGLDDRQLDVASEGGFDAAWKPIGFDDGGLLVSDVAVAADGEPPSSRDGSPIADGTEVGSPASGGNGCYHFGEDGGPDCGDTLVQNADFNRNLTDWKPGNAFGTIDWAAKDSQDSRRSGSIAVANTYQAQNDGQVAAHGAQCVSVTPGVIYTFTAEAYIPDGQSYGYGVLDVWFYSEENCGGLPDGGVYNVTLTDVIGKWVPLIPGSLIAPDSAKSMSVRLGAQKPIRSKPPFQALFDAVRVTKPQN